MGGEKVRESYPKWLLRIYNKLPRNMKPLFLFSCTYGKATHVQRVFFSVPNKPGDGEENTQVVSSSWGLETNVNFLW